MNGRVLKRALPACVLAVLATTVGVVPVSGATPDPFLGGAFAQGDVLAYRWASGAVPPSAIKTAIYEHPEFVAWATIFVVFLATVNNFLLCPDNGYPINAWSLVLRPFTIWFVYAYTTPTTGLWAACIDSMMPINFSYKVAVDKAEKN